MTVTNHFLCSVSGLDLFSLWYDDGSNQSLSPPTGKWEQQHLMFKVTTDPHLPSMHIHTIKVTHTITITHMHTYTHSWNATLVSSTTSTSVSVCVLRSQDLRQTFTTSFPMDCKSELISLSLFPWKPEFYIAVITPLTSPQCADFTTYFLYIFVLSPTPHTPS